MLLSRSQKPFKLTQIIDILALLSQNQPRKYVMLKFSSNCLDITTKDDTSTIFIGVKLNKQAFSAYICQTNCDILLPLQKLSKILNLPSDLDDSITVSYQGPSEEIKFRIHSTKNNLKTIVSLQILRLQIQDKMVNEQYQEPKNPIEIIERLRQQEQNPFQMSLGILTTKKQKEFSHFSISIVEFYRICKEYSQVCQTISISLQAEEGSNKKYMIFSGMTLNGAKTISLNEQRSKKQIQQSLLSKSRLAIREFFLVSSLLKIMSMTVNYEIFDENIQIILERKKSVLLVCQLKEKDGSVVFMSSSLPNSDYF